jgi:tetratricopeptide (TPR) repeat protein
MDRNTRLFQVKLTLTADNDNDLRILTDRIREETFPNYKEWFQLSLVLCKMSQFNKAPQIYEILLEETTNESEKGYIYDRLGAAHDDKGDYQKAIKFYKKKSLEIGHVK